MPYAIDPVLPTAIPIEGSSELFPVRRVYCVGRNYAEHAIEMGHDPNREPPFFFQKNPDNIVLDGRFAYPAQTSDVHHEVELVVCLGKGGENISVSEAHCHVYGYAVGLDMTRRDLQNTAKKMGRPWEAAKAFEGSAPLSPVRKVSETGNLRSGAIWLKVNGDLRQTSDLSQMIWNVSEAIAHLSGLFRLAPGDIIMTGTPAGVGPIKPGDHLQAHIDNVGLLTVDVC